MDACHCHVDRVLDHSVVTLDTDEVSSDVVVDLDVIQTGIILSVDVADLVEFLLEGTSHEWGHVEIECRDGLATVHLVLDCLHRDASQDAGCLDSLCRT